MTELTDAKGLLLPAVETPSADVLRAYGDFFFLAMRSAHHRSMTTATLASSAVPPIMANQYKVFRFDGVPRGLFTWAWLSPEAERRYVSGELLLDTDWRSGEHLWIIDLIAPYRGLTASMVRWITVPGNLTQKDFRFRRVENGKATRRIVHIDFNRPGALSRIETAADFL